MSYIRAAPSDLFPSPAFLTASAVMTNSPSESLAGILSEVPVPGPKTSPPAAPVNGKAAIPVGAPGVPEVIPNNGLAPKLLASWEPLYDG